MTKSNHHRGAHTRNWFARVHPGDFTAIPTDLDSEHAAELSLLNREGIIPADD
jgi:hypothetical protein